MYRMLRARQFGELVSRMCNPSRRSAIYYRSILHQSSDLHICNIFSHKKKKNNFQKELFDKNIRGDWQIKYFKVDLKL